LPYWPIILKNKPANLKKEYGLKNQFIIDIKLTIALKYKGTVTPQAIVVKNNTTLYSETILIQNRRKALFNQRVLFK
jgi:hypothetical protein